MFSRKKSYWVKVTLTNGKVVGGKYASNSFASSAPSEEQIYLEQSWIIKDKGGFERAKINTAGILIKHDEITYLEFFDFYLQQPKKGKLK